MVVFYYRGEKVFKIISVQVLSSYLLKAQAILSCLFDCSRPWGKQFLAFYSQLLPSLVKEGVTPSWRFFSGGKLGVLLDFDLAVGLPACS